MTAVARRGTRPAHVLIVVQNLPVPFDRRVWLECRSLRARGFDVTVICPTGGKHTERHEVLEGIQIHRYPAPPAAEGVAGYAYEFGYCWLRTAALAVQVYLRQPFDVIQACNPPDTYFALAAAFKALGVRFVYDQHDLCPEVYECRFDRPRKVLLRGLLALERATYRVADAVVSTNQSYREVAIRRGELAGERVSVVRTGPDPERLRPVPPEPELRHGREHLCCYLGVMGPQDGVDILVRVVAAVVHHLRRTDCHFALLGFGDSLDELKALARELEVEEWITFTGRADDSMIRTYLSTADVGVSPDPKTPFNDLSTHNKTMEYMAMGLPVVTFDLKETRVSAGDAAVYVDSGSDAVLAFAYALVCLIDSPRKRAHLAGVGRERVEHELAWALQAPGYVEVFERLLGTG